MVDVDEEDSVGASDETYKRADSCSAYTAEYAGESPYDDLSVAVERRGEPGGGPGRGGSRDGYDDVPPSAGPW